MELYTFCLVLGAAGLAVMAFSGLGHHGPGHAHGGHGHAGHSHAGHHHGAPANSHGHDAGGSRLLSLLSPRVIFSALVGFGATGILLRHLLSGPLLLGAALAGGIVFEALLVAPLWNLLFRFASKPALTLESCITDEARAVSGFDRNGQGLIAIDLDGQVVQVLGTLRPEDVSAGVRVRAGDKVRVEEVDTARNRCTVSPLGG